MTIYRLKYRRKLGYPGATMLPKITAQEAEGFGDALVYTLRQQEGLKQEDDQTNRRHRPWAEKHRAETGAGWVRTTAGDRGQFEGRKHEGERGSDTEQHALFRVFPQVSIDGTQPVGHERRRGQ